MKTTSKVTIQLKITRHFIVLQFIGLPVAYDKKVIFNKFDVEKHLDRNISEANMFQVSLKNHIFELMNPAASAAPIVGFIAFEPMNVVSIHGSVPSVNFKDLTEDIKPIFESKLINFFNDPNVGEQFPDVELEFRWTA